MQTKTWTYSAIAALLVVTAGVVHGKWTDRWGSADDTIEAANRLTTIPMNVGDWEGTDLKTTADPSLGVAGCLQRSFRNRRTGATVVIALVNGRPGPVSTHTPDVCYGASGYVVGERQEVNLDTNGEIRHFWTSPAVRTTQTEETRLRIYWAWNGGQGWVASPDARSQFSRFRYPILNKLYVLRQMSATGAQASQRDPVCEEFMAAFLPLLNESLYGQGG